MFKMFKNCRKDKECCALSSCQLSVSCPGIHYYMICSLIAGCKGYFSGFFVFYFFFLLSLGQDTAI